MSTLKQTTFEVIHDLDKAKGADEVLEALRRWLIAVTPVPSTASSASA
jgi:hypothetical protein